MMVLSVETVIQAYLKFAIKLSPSTKTQSYSHSLEIFISIHELNFSPPPPGELPSFEKISAKRNVSALFLILLSVPSNEKTKKTAQT